MLDSTIRKAASWSWRGSAYYMTLHTFWRRPRMLREIDSDQDIGILTQVCLRKFVNSEEGPV